MGAVTVVGMRPWLPWPLSRWRWWTEPVPAERLAALRVGVAGVLLLDLLLTYLPECRLFYGAGSWGDPAALAERLHPGSWNWSILRFVDDPRLLQTAMVLWIAAGLGLLLGWATRFCAVLAWVLSVSFSNLNPEIENAGDLSRSILLFYLMLTPCGAVWALDRRRWGREPGPRHVFPWALRLLFVQMVFIYFCNGVFKLQGADWRSGESLYRVLGDLTLARWSYAQFPIPFGITQLLTWFVLAWEVTFPLMVWWRWTRFVALLFGVLFHVGIGLSMELGGFAPYMLCFYLPLIPWERWIRPRPLAA